MTFEVAGLFKSEAYETDTSCLIIEKTEGVYGVIFKTAEDFYAHIAAVGFRLGKTNNISKAVELCSQLNEVRQEPIRKVVVFY